MKTIYTWFFITLLAASAYAAPVIRAVNNNGKWNAASTWNLNRKPQNGDTILIPANIQVILDNNEGLDNLFVQITGTLRLANGKLNLNSASRIEIMAQGRLTGLGNNDQVRIGNVFKFRGGVDLAVMGPAYADASTGSSPNGFDGGFTILNAGVTGFYATVTDNEVQLRWTSTPGNTLKFEVEKSLNGNDWATIGQVNVSGNTGIQHQYTYSDKTMLLTTVYYRIKQVFAGNVAYTSVKTVRTDDKADFHVYAGSGHIRVRFNRSFNGSVTITVADLDGRIVARRSVDRPVQLETVQLKSLNKGTYVVELAGNGVSQTRKFVL